MDNEYLDIIGLGIFKALNDKRYPILVNGKISESAIPTSITNSITSILSLIPDAASSENKLADKNFVNSSIATNTATFRGTFDDLATLQATSADINDYAFYVHTDEIGNTAYDRYKHNGSAWVFEYTLNNSSFTAEQWSAINSGITTTKVGNYDAHLINYSNPHKVTKSQVGLGNVENVALSSWAGSNKITTLGTITTGVWNGSKIGNDYLANSSITIGTTAISLGSTAKSLAGIEKLQLNDANSNLVYDSTTGSWKLTGNLLVTGFISAGAKGNSSSGGGSTYTQREWAEIKIMSASEIGLLASAYSVKEAYDELNAAIETLAGKATNVTFSQTLTSGKQIGSISIDGKSTSLFAPANYAWSEVTGKPTFATVATSGSYTDLTNKPTIASLMGSTAIGSTSAYPYWTGSAWATKALGSNAFTSISKVSQLTNDSGYITGITKSMVEGVLTGDITSHTHSYLPLAGGTLTGDLYINTTLYGPSVGSNPRNRYDSGLYFFNCSGATTSAYNFGLYQWADEFQFTFRTSSNNSYKGNAFTIQGSDGQVAFTKTPKVGSTLVSLEGHTHSYLPLSGGAMANTNVVTNLNADFLDGYDASQVLTSHSSATVDLNEISVPSIYRISTENPNLPSSIFNYGNLLTVKYPTGDTAWQLLGAYSSDNLWFRRGTWYADGTGTLRTNAWKTIAFTDSNVASSSKWATPRTITLTGSVTGSVSIDGSGNVSLATTTNHTHLYAGSATAGGAANTLLGDYVGGQGPNYFGKNKVGALMMGTAVNSNYTWKDWLILDCYSNDNAGGAVAFGISRETLGAFIMRSNADRASWAESAELLGTHNYNSYAPKLDGTGASGTWGISISGNAATATNADTLDGVHFQNILERETSGLTRGTDVGWYRIAETYQNNSDSYAFLLGIQRSYGNIMNETYLFSICISYRGRISITQLSGSANVRLIDKIRVDWGRNAYYIDLYINTATGGNTYRWYTVGAAKSYTAWTANPTLNGTAYEFTTVNGCKSDLGFTGDLTGNAATADNLAKTFIENINYAARTTGLKLIRYDDNWEANGFPEKWTSGLSVMAGYCGWQLVTYGGSADTPYFRKVSDSGVWSNWRALAFTDSNISGNAATATNADKLDGYHASSFSKTKIIDLPVGQVLRISMEYRRGFLISMQASNGGRNALYFVTGYGDGTTIRNDIRVIKGGPYNLYFNGTSEAGYVYIVGTSTNTAANDYICINPFDYNDITYTIVSSVPSDAVLVSSSNSNILATLDSNVASSSKLANSRTIWGQSFDGTGNVSGALSGVTDIKANGVIYSNRYNSSGNTAGAAFVFNKGDDLFGIGVSSGRVSNVGFGTVTGIDGTWKNEIMTITNTNNVGIGTTSPSYKLHIVGVAYASEGLVSDGYISAASTSTSSDIRLKDNISEISSEMALKWLLNLKPKSWSWNSLAGVKGRSMGFVAQDVEGILPQMIRKRRDNDYLSLDYTQLHAIEVSALQSHEKRIEELERENKILKEEINKLKQYAN